MPLRAIVVGSVVFVPAAFLALLFVLPAVAWLALVGLVVPVLVLERPGSGAAFRRAVQLARADYLHALGSLATLVILFGLVKLSLARAPARPRRLGRTRRARPRRPRRVAAPLPRRRAPLRRPGRHEYDRAPEQKSELTTRRSDRCRPT